MKKILLILVAAIVMTSCNLGSLNYAQSPSDYILEDLAGTMAYDGLSIPVQILNAIDWSRTDIFDPAFRGSFTCGYQTMDVVRVPGDDILWMFSTVKSEDRVNVECLYLRMLPDDGSGFNLWEANGSIHYSEDGTGYEAMLTLGPVEYSWKESVDTSWSRYEKYLVVNGSGQFTTRHHSQENPLSHGTYILSDNEVTPYNGYRLEGKLELK